MTEWIQYVEQQVKQFQQSISKIDDELEHSKPGISDSAEYGWDQLRYAAANRSKSNFLTWLQGMILCLESDIKASHKNEELDKWRLYLDFLKEIESELSERGSGE